MDKQVLAKIYALLKERKLADPKSSYTAGLYASGLPVITRKLMEEAYEVVEAAYLQGNSQPQKTREHLIHEIADLWYHSMVLSCHQNIELDEILKELQQRMGTSGYEEKQNREAKK